MDFIRLALQAPQGRMSALRQFYAGTLGLSSRGDNSYGVGVSELEFQAAAGEPFYHFALLVPGNRFDAALAWADERVELLPGGDIKEFIFQFDDWDALACYFHDPAGNIVELIAHRGIDAGGATGRFSATELLGISEVGLVGDPPEMVPSLEHLGLQVWDGEIGELDRLAFVGERARALILAPEGRGWLPTRRPAEPHPVSVVLTGPPTGEVTTAGHHVCRE